MPKIQINVEDVVRQADYVIAGGTAAELPILDLAVKHNIKILPVTADIDALFKDIPVPAEIENVKKNLLNNLENDYL